MRIQITDGTKSIFVSLIDSSLSKSLIDQLPLQVSLQDFSTNERYFHSPQPLQTDMHYETSCPAGSLGYFAPWHNICLFYKEAPAYPGQYMIGKVEGDPNDIQKLNDKVTIQITSK